MRAVPRPGTIHSMGVGPITIFDKSALQSLNADESVWLDAFFLINVVPIFYVETLADLEKGTSKGTPESLVSMLASKTPTGAVPNVHHRSLISAELTGHPVLMDGRPRIAGGETVRDANGVVGVRVDEFTEAVMLERWIDGAFTEPERDVARQWRVELATLDPDKTLQTIRLLFPRERRFSNLAELKRAIDEFLKGADDQVVRLVLELVALPDSAVRLVLRRWERAGRSELSDFAPYTTHVATVDLLYYLGIDRGFISGDRPSNRVDMAYLYYLPFTMVFTSGDKLHVRTAPLFLRPDQSFVEAGGLKAALAELNAYYAELPEEIKGLGVLAFAHYPPPELANLVVRLWDKHMRPGWRDHAISPQEAAKRLKDAAGREDRAAIELGELIDGAEAIATNPTLTEDHEFIVIKRRMPHRKGSWRLAPKDSDGPDPAS